MYDGKCWVDTVRAECLPCLSTLSKPRSHSKRGTASPQPPTLGLQNRCTWVKSVVGKYHVPCSPFYIGNLHPVFLPPPPHPRLPMDLLFVLWWVQVARLKHYLLLWPAHCSLIFFPRLPLIYSYFFSSKYFIFSVYFTFSLMMKDWKRSAGYSTVWALILCVLYCRHGYSVSIFHFL